MRPRVWKILIALLPWITGQAHAAIETGFETPDPLLLEEIRQAFPEGQPVAPRLLDFEVDPNLHLFREAGIQVTFWGEGAALENSFGYFLYQDLNEDGAIDPEEVLQRTVLWDNVSQLEDGAGLQPGSALRLGRFPAETRMGFFLIADGFRGGREIYYSLDRWNPDGKRHLAMLATADHRHIVLGIEDLPWAASDHDYNDILFTVTADPPSALAEAIEAGNIPVQGPAPQEAAPAPPETSSTTSAPHISPGAAVPLLEGCGLGCQLGSTEAMPAKRSFLALHWLGLVYAYARYRDRKSRRALAARPAEQVAQARCEIGAVRSGASGGAG